MATKEKIITNIDEALAAVGVTYNTLSKQEKQSLDEQGYVVLPKVADGKWLQQLRDGFEAGEKSTPSKGGTRHPTNLIEQGEVYERVITNPRLLAAVHHILKDEFKLNSISGRDPLPGYGEQGLHPDWGEGLGDPNVYIVATALWMLDDFTVNNGATRVVPGSHKHWQNLPKAMAQPTAVHPQQVTVQGKAGSILVFNGYLWHAGQRNNTQLMRRALQIPFSLRGYRNFESNPPTNFDQLSPAAKYILGSN